MYRPLLPPYHATPTGQHRLLPRGHPPPQRMANPYLLRRETVHSRDMPNPYAFPVILPPQLRSPPVARMAPEARPLQPSWSLQPRYEARTEFVSAQEVLVRGFHGYPPRNLEQDLNIQLGVASSKEPDMPDLDYGQWQRDADRSLDSLGNESFDFGPIGSNPFKPTEEEAEAIVHSSTHEKKVIKAHEQFIRMLRSNKTTEAFANYDGTYDFQFYRIFQGAKTTAKKTPSTTYFAFGRTSSIIAWMASPTNHRALCLFYTLFLGSYLDVE